MFRIFACVWLTLAIPFFGLGEEPEDETYLALRSPAQYFAAESHDSRYWTILHFPMRAFISPRLIANLAFIWRGMI